MKVLMIPTMLLVLNAAPIPSKNDQKEGSDPTTVLEKRILLVSPIHPKVLVKGNPVKSPMQTIHPKVLVKGNPVEVPLELQERISKIFKEQKLKVSFDEAFKRANEEGATEDQAYWLAYKLHDPSKEKEGYPLVKEWLDAKDVNAQTKLLGRMQLNKKYRKVLRWGKKNGFSNINIHQKFRDAVTQEKPVIVNYLIAKGYKPSTAEIDDAIRIGNLDIFRDIYNFLIKDPDFEVNQKHLGEAIFSKRANIVSEILKILHNDPNQPYIGDARFRDAIEQGDEDVIQILIDEGGIVVTPEHLAYANQLKSPEKIVTFLKQKLNPLAK